MNWPLEDCCFAQLFRILKQLTLFLSFSELVGLSSNFCNPRGGFKAFLSSCWVNRSNTQMNESESKGIFIIRLFGPKKRWPKLMWTVCSSFASVNFTLDNYVSSWQQRVVLKLHRPAYRLLCTFLTEPAVGISSRHRHLFSLLKFPKKTNHSKCVAEEHFCHSRTRNLTLSFSI